VKELKKHQDVEECEYRGIQEFADSSLKYQVKVYCNPIKKVQVRRDCLVSIIKELECHKVSIPYNQIDIQQK